MHRLKRPAAPLCWQSEIDAYVRTDPAREGRTETARWTNFCCEKQPVYQEAKETLAENQRNLCAYCEICTGDNNRQIEHVRPKSDPNAGGDLTFQFSNFVLCCKGGTNPYCPDEGAHYEDLGINISCGQAKGDTNSNNTLINPYDLPLLIIFKTSLDKYGMAIAPNEDNCARVGIPVALVHNTIKTLNLNCPRLCRVRGALWTKTAQRIDRIFAKKKLSKRKQKKAYKKALIALQSHILHELHCPSQYHTTIMLCYLAKIPWIAPQYIL